MNSLRKACLLGTLLFGALCTSSLPAQTATVRGGSMGILFDPALSTALQSQGIALQIISTTASFNGASRFAVTSGNLDRVTGGGEIHTEGGLRLSAPGVAKMELENMSFETSGSGPVITATYYIDGKFMGRGPYLNILTANPLGAHLKQGVDTILGIQATLSPFFTNMVSIIFKSNVLQANTGLHIVDFLTRLYTTKDPDGCKDPSLCVVN